MKDKLMSRKLWAGIAGLILGICLIISGNVAEGAATAIASVLGYIVAEGYIDAKAVNLMLEVAEEIVDTVQEQTEANDEK